MATDNSVVLNFNGKEEKIRLINNKIQISAVKDAFNLRTVQLNGLTEPIDQLGFTVAEFSPGTVVNISGSPTTGATVRLPAQDRPYARSLLASLWRPHFCVRSELGCGVCPEWAGLWVQQWWLHDCGLQGTNHP